VKIPVAKQFNSFWKYLFPYILKFHFCFERKYYHFLENICVQIRDAIV